MRGPIIPKELPVPELNAKQIEELTELIFLPNKTLTYCDVIFVFAGTHPGHWEKPIEAYQKGLSKKIIVTGGVSPTGKKHPHWIDDSIPESEVIVSKLIESGINEADIVFENRSRNTLENVLFAKEMFDFNSVNSIALVCKNHAAGRQYRTLVKHLPNHISYAPYGFNAQYKGIMVTKDNWMKSDIGRTRVIGEYLRIINYGKSGHLKPVENEIEGLENVIRSRL